MAFQGSGETPASSSEDHAFPLGRPPRSNSHRPASVVSSRMTDIASEDEGEGKGAASKTNRPKGSEAAARPGTGKTGASYKGPWAGGTRKNFAGGVPPKRGSITSTTGGLRGRTPSLTSRSHVPSLTSNAFFHPMSSQKLQAQRAGAARPPPPPTTTTQSPQPSQMGDFNDNATDIDGSVIHDLASLSNHIAPVQHIVYGEDNRLAPPSRGTEMTEQETYDRITGTTSTSQGNYASGSMTDSIRPLNKKPSQDKAHPQLSLNTDKSFKNLPSPVKSPRSFSSSFLIPGRGDQGQTGQNRNTDGAEKLSSVASSPRLNPVDSRGRSKPEVPRTPTQRQGKGRNYEYFEGNTAFYFGGRWQNTRQRPINVVTGLFVVVPCVLFFVFEASWLWNNISPAIPIVFAYLAYICFSSFIHASVSDPGILPRNLHQFPALASHEDPLRVDPPTNDWTLIKSAEPTAAAMEVPVKHCRTCNIWRPPRAHHCRLCDNCVETHDHHCVWLNNCVGKRNYRLFFTFVSSGTILSAYLIAASLTQLLVYMNREGVSFGQAIDHFRGPFALVIIGVLAFCYPAALMGYHVFLMVRGETTREFMNSHKFAKKERYRAFSQGSLVRNLLAVLCRPRSPTYYRFKNKYQTGDQRLGDRRDRHHQRHTSQGVEMDRVQGFQGPVALRGAVQDGQ